MSDQPTPRVHFIDWLRILAILLLFPFHVLGVFSAKGDFYVKADQLSEAVTSLLDFISLWHMPLLFFLAGCSTYLALRTRCSRLYAWERVRRLLVPLVFGVLVLVPPQTWFGARFNTAYSSSFWHYLSSGDFLRWNLQDAWGLDPGFYGGFSLAHLWFILFLLLISLIALPLLAWGTRAGGAAQVQRSCRALARPVWWVLPIVVFFLAYAVATIAHTLFLFYLVIFAIGWIAMADPSFVKAAARFRLPAIVGGLALSLFWVFSAGWRDSLPDRSLSFAGLGLLGMAAVWLMLVASIGFGKRYLDHTSPTQRYLAEASYPVYILHQTVIVILAFYIVQAAIPAGAQAVVLFVPAVAATFLLYEIVRRVGVLRFLFGMRARQVAPPVAAAEPVAEES